MELKDLPAWQAIDQLCRAAKLTWSMEKDASLVLTPGKALPPETIAYGGPFRFQATSWRHIRDRSLQPGQPGEDQLTLQCKLYGVVPPGMAISQPRVLRASDRADKPLTLLAEPNAPFFTLPSGLIQKTLRVGLLGGSLQEDDIKDLQVALPLEVFVPHRMLAQIKDVQPDHTQAKLGASGARVIIDKVNQQTGALGFTLSVSDGTWDGRALILYLSDSAGRWQRVLTQNLEIVPPQGLSPEEGLLLPGLPMPGLPGRLAGLALAGGRAQRKKTLLIPSSAPFQMPLTIAVHEARKVRTEVRFTLHFPARSSSRQGSVSGETNR
jgi:hypothetical protein